MSRDVAYRDGYLPLFAGAELVRRSGSLTQFPADNLIGTLPPVVITCPVLSGFALRTETTPLAQLHNNPKDIIRWFPTGGPTVDAQWGPLNGMFTENSPVAVIQTVGLSNTAYWRPVATGFGLHGAVMYPPQPIPYDVCNVTLSTSFRTFANDSNRRGLIEFEWFFGGDLPVAGTTPYNGLALSLNQTGNAYRLAGCVHRNNAPGDSAGHTFNCPLSQEQVHSFIGTGMRLDILVRIRPSEGKTYFQFGWGGSYLPEVSVPLVPRMAGAWGVHMGMVEFGSPSNLDALAFSDISFTQTPF